MAKYRYSGGVALDIPAVGGGCVTVQPGETLDAKNDPVLAETCNTHPDFRPVKSPKTKDE